MTPSAIISAAREVCPKSLAAFVKLAWPVIEPGQEYIHGRHVDVMCEHLEAVSHGQIRKLIINIPPGCMKSSLVGVFWPMWEWGPLNRPATRFVGVSHEQNLGIRDNLKCRRLATSTWYQRRWGDRVQLSKDQNEKLNFENLQTGFRLVSTPSNITGRRGDRVIVDDPISVANANSQAEREKVNTWARESLPSRLNNPDSSAIVIVMQRVHENDMSGLLLADDFGFEHLCLPMRYETNRIYSTSLGKVDWRTEEGQLLFPERFPLEVVDNLEKTMGSYATAGQHQQRPAPREGGIFKKNWWQYFKIRPQIKRIIQSWDTAFKTKQENDYSVCTTWAECENGYYLLDRYKDKIEYPELKRAAINLAATHKPHAVLVEDKASGQTLIQELKRDTNLPIIPIKVDSDKISRAYAVTPLIESGRVFLPEAAEWLVDYLEAMGNFPNGAHDDDVDSTTQAINYLARGGGGLGLFDYYLSKSVNGKDSNE
jgi:predicted phage terminase large subunit-like protein